MRVTVVGLGYVGLVTGACVADWGHEVIGVDKDPARLEALLEGRMPFHEPRLPELVAAGVETGNLTFSSDLVGAATSADIVVIAVGTHDGNGGWQTDTVRACLAELVPGDGRRRDPGRSLHPPARLHHPAADPGRAIAGRRPGVRRSR